MGTSYYYTNLTKREWFRVGAFGGCGNWRGLGKNLASRALGLLLFPSKGWWGGDSITIIGDSDNSWPQYDAEFADLEADVILLVYRNDGFEEIGEAAEHNDLLFMQICHLLVMRQALELEYHMTAKFGSKYLGRYKTLCEGAPWFKPKDLTHLFPSPRER